MNRRQFLSFLAAGAAVSSAVPHLGLLERIRTYFFAPRQGWQVLYGQGPFTLYGGARGGGKMLSLTEMDRLLREHYQPVIVRELMRSGTLFDAMAERRTQSVSLAFSSPILRLA